MRGLPPDLKDLKKCSVRIAAKDPQYRANNQKNTGGDAIFLKGMLPSAKFEESVVAFNEIGIKSKETVAVGTSGKLCDAIKTQYAAGAGEALFTLTLYTSSDKAGALFYSSKNFGDNPSNIPRLVVEYTLGTPTLLETLSWSQHQQNPEHTGRTPWIPFKNPSGFTLMPINMQKGSIADYPLIHQGNLYLVNKVEATNYLVAIDFKGKELWRKDIGKGVVQRSPVISRNGILYVVTENNIAGYDLKPPDPSTNSEPVKPFAVYTLQGGGKLSAYTDLTMGNDGSLFLALKEGDANYVYGFTPELKPFLKFGPYGAGQDKISTITVSPGGGIISFQTPTGAVIIDISDISAPAKEKTVTLKQDKEHPWEDYHTPVAGPEKGIMIFSDFTSKANNGNVWAYHYRHNDAKQRWEWKEKLWSAHGTLIPQPVLGSNGIVYYLQNGALQRHVYNQLGQGKTPVGSGLNTTSNMVLDGADNVYFWDNGYLYGYSSSGERLFKASFINGSVLEKKRTANPEEVSAGEKAERVDASMGPEQFIRLTAGPDGTLWANNENGNALFAFTPSFAEQGLELTQQDMKTRTVYRTSGTLTVGPVTLETGTQVLFQARKGIAFTRGFRAQNGASLLCRTGF
jgi:hypothetical protein